MQLDHIVIACPDLAAARRQFTQQTGCTPMDGGPHRGRGTRNLLASLGHGAGYIELIGPDPQQPRPPLGLPADLPAPQLLHWAVQSRDLHERPAATLRDAGLQPGKILDLARRTPDGNTLEWQLMGVGGHHLGGCIPFFIDWLHCPHPADTAPIAGSLLNFEVCLPDPADPVGRLLDQINNVTTSAGPPRLELTIQTPNGAITWQQDTPQGFDF